MMELERIFDIALGALFGASIVWAFEAIPSLKLAEPPPPIESFDSLPSSNAFEVFGANRLWYNNREIYFSGKECESPFATPTFWSPAMGYRAERCDADQYIYPR